MATKTTEVKYPTLESMPPELRADLELTIATTFRVLACLTAVETCRGGWRARCPCHNDEMQSLTVGVSDLAYAHVGLVCAAGCDPARVYAAVGLPRPQRWAM